MTASTMSGARSGVLAALALATALPGLATASPLAAQESFEIRGTVADSDGAGLENAMVVALTRPDSVLARYALTSGDGRFVVSGLKPGEYILQVTIIGYAAHRSDFVISAEDVEAGRVTLASQAVALDSLVVSVEHVPFVNNRDTLSYNPLAFQTPPNSTVEDLLRRLPGIEVEDDGSIKAQGEDVQQVLVDGKEFFGRDPTIATRNLPADAIKQVDVYDKQSDMAEFTGIADGEEERTIDLRLKEEAKVGHFGSANGGVGDGVTGVPALAGIPVPETGPSGEGARYEGALYMARFSPSTQLALNGGATNVGGSGFSVGHALGGSNGLLAAGGGGRGGGSGFTEALNLALNASRDIGEDHWLRGSYTFNNVENLNDQIVQRSGLLGPTAGSISDRTNRRTTDNLNHQMHLNGQIAFSEGHELRVRANGSLRSSLTANRVDEITHALDGSLLNSAATDNLSDGRDSGIGGSLTWRKRLADDGRSVVAQLNSNLTDSKDSTELSSTVAGLGRGGSGSTDVREILQDQSLDGRTWSNSVRVSLTQPLNESHTLEVYGRRNATLQDRDNVVKDLVNGVYVPNELQSSGFERAYSYLRGGTRFSRRSEASWATIGVEVQRSQLDGTITGRDETIENGYTHVLATAEVKSEVKNGHTLTLNYSGSTQEPSLNQLQPYSNNTDPLNVYVGNPDLQPEYTHRVRADYRFFDQFSFVNLFTFARFNYTHDNISTSSIFDEQGFQTRMPVNSGAAWSSSLGASFGTPVRKLGLDLDLEYSLDWSESTAMINLQANDSRVLGNSFEIGLDNRNKESFDLRVAATFDFNDVAYSLNQELDRNYMNSRYAATGTWYLGPAWELESSLRYFVYDDAVFDNQSGSAAGLENSAGENVAYWNAALSRRVMNDRAELILGVNDLLNQNQGVSITNSANFVQEARTTSMGRTLMLRVMYRLGVRMGRMRWGK